MEKWKQQDGGPGSKDSANTISGGGICEETMTRKPTFPLEPKSGAPPRLIFFFHRRPFEVEKRVSETTQRGLFGEAEDCCYVSYVSCSSGRGMDPMVCFGAKSPASCRGQIGISVDPVPSW